MASAARSRRDFADRQTSIYIFHFAIIMLISFILAELFSIKSGEISNYFIWIVFLPPILLGCWTLYFFTEGPCNNYLKQLRAVERGKAAQLAAALASAENPTTPADARRRVNSFS
ncbi:MAG TPA: hypothetical protein VIF02_11735 [Methylocella sp.]